MISQVNLSMDFEREVSAALLGAAELARDDAIKTNTGIVVSRNGEVITITAEQLRQKNIPLNKPSAPCVEKT